MKERKIRKERKKGRKERKKERSKETNKARKKIERKHEINKQRKKEGEKERKIEGRKETTKQKKERTKEARKERKKGSVMFPHLLVAPLPFPKAPATQIIFLQYIVGGIIQSAGKFVFVLETILPCQSFAFSSSSAPVFSLVHSARIVTTTQRWAVVLLVQKKERK
jgi:hypothetical protein